MVWAVGSRPRIVVRGRLFAGMTEVGCPSTTWDDVLSARAIPLCSGRAERDGCGTRIIESPPAACTQGGVGLASAYVRGLCP